MKFIQGLLFVLSATHLFAQVNFMDNHCANTVNKITRHVGKELAKEQDMDWLGGEHNLRLTFHIFRPLTQVETRQLLNLCVERELAALNSSLAAVKCNGGESFVARDLDVSIYFSDSHYYALYDPFVSRASVYLGGMRYAYSAPYHRHPDSRKEKEPYSNAGFDLAQVSSKPISLPSLLPVESVLKQIKQKMKTKGVILAGVGYDRDHFSLGFDVYRPMNVEEARRFMVETIEVALAAINSSKELRSKLNDPPFTPDNLTIGIDSYAKKGGGMFPNFTYAPDVGFVYFKNDTLIFGFQDGDLKDRETKESYLDTLELVESPNNLDPVKRFASNLKPDSK